jgi:hypothetical protein
VPFDEEAGHASFEVDLASSEEVLASLAVHFEEDHAFVGALEHLASLEVDQGVLDLVEYVVVVAAAVVEELLTKLTEVVEHLVERVASKNEM